MSSTSLTTIPNSARSKLNRLQASLLSYLILSMFEGMFIGFAILLSYIIRGLFA